MTAADIWATIGQALPVIGAVAALLEWRFRQLDQRQSERHADLTRRMDGVETTQMEIRARMDVDRDRFSDYVAETSRSVATEAFVLEQVGSLKSRIEGIAEHCWQNHLERKP